MLREPTCLASSHVGITLTKMGKLRLRQVTAFLPCWPSWGWRCFIVGWALFVGLHLCFTTSLSPLGNMDQALSCLSSSAPALSSGTPFLHTLCPPGWGLTLRVHPGFPDLMLSSGASQWPRPLYGPSHTLVLRACLSH